MLGRRAAVRLDPWVHTWLVRAVTELAPVKETKGGVRESVCVRLDPWVHTRLVRAVTELAPVCVHVRVRVCVLVQCCCGWHK